MISKKLMAGMLAASLVVTTFPASLSNVSTVEAADVEEIVVQKTECSNPIGGYDTDGNLIYGGDPAVLVDGDTVYLYTGHDTAKSEAYEILEWMCYSTKDLKNWKYEGVTMKADKASITWANTGTDAWAGQVEKYNGKYYFYYCTWDSTSSGKQSIGVAVSDSATGPFTDIGQPLVKGTLTDPQTSDWNDIDPTVWVEKDSNGVEHRYLAWGNGKFYVCELNKDMISIKDLDGDGKITMGKDIIDRSTGLDSFTEAPWLYRRKDTDGDAAGLYYLFYAYKWREEMAYATTDDLLNGEWKFGDVLMPPAATSNTNHMAVFDFKGKTYFVYHNGTLPGGSGFRRNACIAELHFKADGSINVIPETAIGITGAEPYVLYTKTGAVVSHENFVNSSSDGEYPYKNVPVGTYFQPKKQDANWAIVAGKADSAKASYVSIQSNNKPGLYLTVNADDTITLAQDAGYTVSGDKFVTDAETAKAQTFRTVKGLSDTNAVSFESVAKAGYYLCIDGGGLIIKKQEECGTGADFYLNVNPSTGGDAANPATTNDLASLTLDGVAQTSTDHVYNYKVPYTQKAVALKATPSDTNGFITLNGKIMGSDGSATIQLNGVYTKVAICVHSADKKPRVTYTVIIQKDFSTFTASATAVKEFNFEDATDGAVAVTKASTPAAVNDPKYSYEAGVTGKAITLDGTYGLKLCDAKDVDLGDSYTISFFMKPTAVGAAVDPTLAGGTFSPEYWLSLTFDGKIWSKNSTTDYVATNASNAYKANEWQQVTLVVDGAKAGTAKETVAASLYVNGALASSGDIGKGILTNANSALYFGVNAWDAYFKGAVDNIKLYKGALSEDEVVGMAASQITFTAPAAEAQPNPDAVTSADTFSEGDLVDTDVVDSVLPADPNKKKPNTPNKKKTVVKVVITKKGSSKAIKKTLTLKKKKTLKLAAKVTVKNGASKKVTWKSSNKKIATVSSKGVVKAKKKKGKVKITATSKADKKKKYTITIKVK